jgi:hypothetical protein
LSLAASRVVGEAFNRGHFDTLPDLFNPDFIEHQFGLHPTIQGMTARGTNRGGFMGPPNGKTFEVTVFDQCRFKGGKIVEHWGSPDRFALLAQLDLLPHRDPA